MESEVSEVSEGLASPSERVSASLQSLDEFLQEEAAKAEAETIKLQTDQNLLKKDVLPKAPKAGANAAAASSLANSSKEISTSLALSSGNSIGRLQEYRQANPNHFGPIFNEENLGHRFTCTVQIGERDQPFGASPPAYFQNKRAAKRHACQLAVEWLIENSFMPTVGVRFPKAITALPPASVKRPKPVTPFQNPSNTSFDPIEIQASAASYVPTLCLSLGLPMPTYSMTANPDFPSMYSGYAHFAGDPRITGKVGEFVNVYGKKNAKETCAVEVVAFLESIKEQRAALDEAERGRVAASKRKRDEDEVGEKET